MRCSDRAARVAFLIGVSAVAATVAAVFTGLESPTHWLVLAVVVLLVFGPKRLPELGRSLGAGMRSFRDAISGTDDPPQRDDPASSDDPN